MLMLVVVRGVIWVVGWSTGTRLARFTRGVIKMILPTAGVTKEQGVLKDQPRPSTYHLNFSLLLIFLMPSLDPSGTEHSLLSWKSLGLSACSLSWLHFRLMRRGKGMIDPN